MERDPARAYAERQAELASRNKDLDGRERSLSALRGVTFLAAGGLGLFGGLRSSVPLGVGAAVAFAAFVVAVVAHAVLITRKAEIELRLALVARGLARIADTYEGFADRGEKLAPEQHPYAKDLDLFGQRSLFQLLVTAETAAGQRALAAWLLTGATAAWGMPLLANGALKPSPADMRFAHDLACDLLRLRASTRLFRLGSAAQIRAKVQFPVSGTWAQVPGVLLMRVDDRAGIPVDDRWSGVTVVFNATPWAVRQTVAGDAGRDWRLHPVQAGGCDGVVAASWCDDGVFAVPGRTAAVFVCPR